MIWGLKSIGMDVPEDSFGQAGTIIWAPRSYASGTAEDVFRAPGDSGRAPEGAFVPFSFSGSCKNAALIFGMFS